jgi:hypothetical protein
MLNTAIWDVDHAVGALLEQSELRRPQPASDCEPRSVSKPGSRPGNTQDLGQAVGVREILEYVARSRGDAALPEARAPWAWRPVWARRQCARVPHVRDCTSRLSVLTVRFTWEWYRWRILAISIEIAWALGKELTAIWLVA